MRRDELRRRLEAAGRTPAPPPRAAFAEGLERRLRAALQFRAARLQAEQERVEATPASAPQAPRRRWSRSPAPLGAAALLLVAITAGALLRADRLPRLQDGPLQLVSVEGPVTVQLPEGPQVPAEPGMAVPDGAVVVTGPAAKLVTSAGTLGPDQVGVVEGSRMRRVNRSPQPSASPRQTSRPSEAREPEPARTEPVQVAPLRPLPGLSRPGQHDDAPRTRETTPAETASPRPDGDAPPGPAPDRASADEEPVHPGSSQPDPEHAIGLSVKRNPEGVAMRWTPFEHPDVAVYLVLWAAAPERPTWPTAGGTEVIGRSRPSQDTFFVDRRPLDRRPIYRIVALDAEGNELARSGAVTPAHEDTARG